MTNGTLNVSRAAAHVGGNGSSTLTLPGTPPQINAALAGLVYQGNPDFNGADTLTRLHRRRPATDTDTVAITVSPVNDAPVNTVPGAQTVNEDTALSIAGVSVTDVGRHAAHHHADRHQRHAQRTTGGGATIGGNGTLRSRFGHAGPDQRGARRPHLQGNLNFNGADTLTVTTGGRHRDRHRHRRHHRQPVNDAPVNTVPGAQSVNEDTALAIGGVWVNDVDGAAHHQAHGEQRHAQRTTGGGATIRRQRHRDPDPVGHAQPRSTRRWPPSPIRATSTSMAPTR